MATGGGLAAENTLSPCHNSRDWSSGLWSEVVKSYYLIVRRTYVQQKAGWVSGLNGFRARNETATGRKQYTRFEKRRRSLGPGPCTSPGPGDYDESMTTGLVSEPKAAPKPPKNARGKPPEASTTQAALTHLGA
jgi:hypothetical protein